MQDVGSGAMSCTHAIQHAKTAHQDGLKCQATDRITKMARGTTKRNAARDLVRFAKRSQSLDYKLYSVKTFARKKGSGVRRATFGLLLPHILFSQTYSKTPELFKKIFDCEAHPEFFGDTDPRSALAP